MFHVRRPSYPIISKTIPLTLPSTAQWMQWLRHTRFDPPSLAEQQADIVRQARIEQLAAKADERWVSKPSVLDAPDKQQPIQMLVSKDPKASVGQMNVEGQKPVDIPVQEGQKEEASRKAEQPQKKVTEELKKSPWPKEPSRKNPGEDWQPASWTPQPARRRG